VSRSFSLPFFPLQSAHRRAKLQLELLPLLFPLPALPCSAARLRRVPRCCWPLRPRPSALSLSSRALAVTMAGRAELAASLPFPLLRSVAGQADLTTAPSASDRVYSALSRRRTRTATAASHRL